MTRPFNLLNHPGLAKQRRLFHRCWTSSAGLMLGCLLAWFGHQWQIAETLRLQQVQSELQTARLERMQQHKEATRQQNQQRLHNEQTVHLHEIARHQQAWMAVHEHLQEMAEGELRLSRLHADAGHVALHGEVNRFEAMALARQSLSDQLGQAIALKDLTTGPAAKVSFVWQTTWPALHSPQKAALVGQAKP